MDFFHNRKRQIGLSIMLVATVAYFAAGVYYRDLPVWLSVAWAIAFVFGKMLRGFSGRPEQKDQASHRVAN